MTSLTQKIKSLLVCSLFLMPLIPSYLGIKPAGSALINIQRVLPLAILFFFIISITKRRFKIKIPADGALNTLFILSLAYTLTRLLSIAASPTKTYSLFIILLESTTVYIAFFISLCTFQEKALCAKKILYYFSTPFVIILISVFFERATESNFFKALAPAALTDSSYISSALEQKIREGSYRSQGPFLHPLVLSQYINFTFPLIALGLSIAVKNRINCLIAISALTITSALGTISTGSRSGLIILVVQLTIALLVLLVRDKRKLIRSSKIVASVPILVIFAYAAGTSEILKEKIEGSNNSELMSTEARLVQYAKGIIALEKSPWLGLGPGNAIEHAYTHNITTGEKSIDSYYLNIMVDSGYISLTLYLCMSIYFSYFLTKNAIALDWSIARYHLAMLCSFLSILATSVTLSSYELFTFSSIALSLVLAQALKISGKSTNER